MDKRNGAILLLCAASVLLLVSLITKGWYRGEKHSATIGIGMWGAGEVCRSGKKRVCFDASVKLKNVKGKSKAWLIFGKTGMIAGVLSALMLLVLSVMVGNRSASTKTAAMAALIGVSITAVCGLLFLILKPDSIAAGLMGRVDTPGIGYSVFLFFPAVAAGIWSALMARAAMDYLEDPPADAAPIA